MTGRETAESAWQVLLKQMRVQNYWSNALEVRVQTGLRYDAEDAGDDVRWGGHGDAAV